jgi:hypothetical protein
MLKAGLSIIISALVFQTGTLAQIHVKSPGNVGIGISTPTDKLHVNGRIRVDAFDNVLSFYSPNNYDWEFLSFQRGIARDAWFGLANNSDFWLNKEKDGNIIYRMLRGNFYVQSGDIDPSVGPGIVLRNVGKGASTPGNPSVRDWAIYNMSNNYGNSLQFWAYDNAGCGSGICNSMMSILDNGNVGIGIPNPAYKLQVAGDARALNFWANAYNYADYVFDSSYQVPSLQEVETYIKQNHHLPEVPSEEEVKKNGINLADHQVILLKKIEELTLYSIDQDKKLQEQAATQKAQNEKLQQLEKALEAIVAENNKMKEALKALKP